jgi:hypothetical protein
MLTVTWIGLVIGVGIGRLGSTARDNFYTQSFERLGNEPSAIIFAGLTCPPTATPGHEAIVPNAVLLQGPLSRWNSAVGLKFAAGWGISVHRSCSRR